MTEEKKYTEDQEIRRRWDGEKQEFLHQIKVDRKEREKVSPHDKM